VTDSVFLPEYQQAVDGVARGPHHSMVRECDGLTANTDYLIDGAKARIFSFAMRKGSPESAFDFVRRKARMRPNQEDEKMYAVLLVLHIALEEAKKDTRYWGIADPALESWCGYCKKALFVTLFNESPHTCDDCYAKRRET